MTINQILSIYTSINKSITFRFQSSDKIKFIFYDIENFNLYSKLNTNKKLIMTCILFHFLRIIVHCLLNYIWLTNKRDKAFLYKILQINHSPLNTTTSTNIQSQMIKARKAFLFVYQKSFLMLFNIHLYIYILYCIHTTTNEINSTTFNYKFISKNYF